MIIEKVKSSNSLMGMRINGLIAEPNQTFAGYFYTFYEEIRKGRGIKKGKEICTVCSENNSKNVTGYSEKVSFENGLCVLFN